MQPAAQSKRSSRRKIPPDELAATAAAALATLPLNKPTVVSSAVVPVLPSAGSIGTAELPLFAGGALQPPETERNGYSASVQNLMVAVSASSVQKRVPGGGTASRRRVPADATATDLDMAVVTDQLCNRRYHVKELSLNMKVGLAD